MTLARPATETVGFVDADAAAYRDRFQDVRSCAHVTRLPLGVISAVARTSLPAIGRLAGVDPHAVHHCLAQAAWDVIQLHPRRRQRPRAALRGRAGGRCIDETADQAYGTLTAAVSRQAIGQRGPVETGLVAVTADGGRAAGTVPRLCAVVTPDRRRKPADPYRPTPTSARERGRTLVQQGGALDLVRAAARDGERGPFLQTVHALKLPSVVAVRAHQGMLLPPGQRSRSPRWRPWARVGSDGSTETRYLREVMSGMRRPVRFCDRTSDPEQLPAASTRFVMTNRGGDLRHELGTLYGLRTWMAAGFTHIKTERGWADHRLTADHAIARWWDVDFRAYRKVRLPTPGCVTADPPAHAAGARAGRRAWWAPGAGWQRTRNNLRLLLQPFCASGLPLRWMAIVPGPGLLDGLQGLVTCINLET